MGRLSEGRGRSSLGEGAMDGVDGCGSHLPRALAAHTRSGRPLSRELPGKRAVR